MAGEPAHFTLGVIGGSGLLKSQMMQTLAAEERTVDTEFGGVKVRVGELSPRVRLIVVQRHAADPDCEYSPPHLVNYQAILQALKNEGAHAVFAVCSVGSMKTHIGMGALIVPDDFFAPYKILSTFTDHRSHNIPEMHAGLREEILTALFSGGHRPLDGGVYVNSLGPRFETKAEIRFMAQYGDIVGMTGSFEATIAKELGLPYAMLAAVDNFANGIGERLSLEDFYREQERNKPRVEDAVHLVLKHFRAYPDVLGRLGAAPAAAEGESPSAAPSPAPSATADVIIHASHIVTVDAEDRVLDAHALAIKDGKIIDILPSEAADEKYGAFSTASMEVQRLPDSALMPGLINAHTHSPMVYMRGFGDDMKLDAWLTTKIWPAEVRCVSDEFVREAARLACAEFISGGTTCFSDMYFFSEAVADVIEETGMRGFVGAIVIEFPSNFAKDADDYLAKGEDMLKRRVGKSDRVGFTVTPHSSYAVNEEHLKRAHEIAKEHGIPLHTHLHETEVEVAESEKGNRESQFCHQCAMACRPLKAFDEFGMVDGNFIAAHMCHLTDEEIATLAEKKANVVHCPTSNLKLASGFCPVQKLVSAGVNVALGTDGAASNNSLDMFAEMKLAAVLAKGVSKDPVALPANVALRMATINGAKALGVADKTGSLEVGKQADVVAVDLSDISSMPTYSVISHLVYATSRYQVSNVWVDGKRLLRNRQLCTIDAGKLRRQAERWQQTISEVDKSHDGSYK